MPSTLMFVLRWHFVEFICGLGALFFGIAGYLNYAPDSPDAPYQSLVGMLGPWPYVVAAIFGAVLAASAWLKGAGLRNG